LLQEGEHDRAAKWNKAEKKNLLYSSFEEKKKRQRRRKNHLRKIINKKTREQAGTQRTVKFMSDGLIAKLGKSGL